MIARRLSQVRAMIITCPNCQTKYQVADQAIGSAGRKVMCAHCHQAWKAKAPPREQAKPKPRIVAGTDAVFDDAPETDRLFESDSEAALDQAFENEDLGRAPGLPDEDAFDGDSLSEEHEADEDLSDAEFDGQDEDSEEALDHRLMSRRARDLAMRQKKQASRMPLARVRRFLRMTALIVFMTLLAGGYWFRVDIVRAFPDLGGLYESVGLPVNIYGLIFTDVETLRTLKDGDDVTIITAKIRSETNHSVRVPPVLVSIMNAAGQPIYEWTARAPVESISPGDVVNFETQLSSAPTEAAHVRLVFGSGTSADPQLERTE